MNDVSPPVDPYQGYLALRDDAPICQLEADGPWQISRHADVHQVLKDNETYSSEVSIRPPEERGQPTMLFSDPPLHHRLRKLVSSAFKPSHIERQADRITARAELLIKDLPRGEAVDLVTTLAAPLPVMVIAEMLGVEDGNLITFKNWSDAIFSNIGEILFGTPSAEAEQAALEMNGYFLEQIEAIRQSPQPHLLGRLIATKTEEGHLNNEELLSFCRLLLIAGNETTTGLITASARIFHEFPETLHAIRHNPELIPTFIEEALRYYSPFSATVRRTTRAVTLGGVEIPKGELLIPLIASANRDERVFDQAATFQIDRNPNPHLALGFGIHFCLGAHLARLEGKIAVQCLADQFESIRLADPSQTEVGGLGGPKAMNVVLT
ncbi:cytochrome P450 [Pseudomonadales bacterium]|nr:cytochrome P450 [Pseudomonadales bacterium]